MSTGTRAVRSVSRPSGATAASAAGGGGSAGGGSTRLAQVGRRLRSTLRLPAPGPARRLRPARPRRFFAWLLALVLLLAGGLAFLFYASAAFTVKTVTVDGAEGQLAKDVVTAAQIPHGRPLARVSEPRVQARVLEDPRIKAVEVERDWPSAVTLVVVPRSPVLTLRGSDGPWHADADGVVYERVAQQDLSTKLPALNVKGEAAELSPQVVAGVVELWRERPDPAQIEGELGTPVLRSDGTVAFTIDGLRVEWGTPTDTELKWKVVQSLIAQESVDPQGDVAQGIDVRVPTTPVVTGLPPAPTTTG